MSATAITETIYNREILNLNTLNEATDGDATFRAEVIRVFTESCKPLIDSYESAMSADDRTRAVLALHTLKGSAHTIGCERLGEACATMERWARSESDIPPPLAPAELRSLLDQALQALRAI